MRYNTHYSQRIKASPDTIAELVTDIRRWPEWSPWLCLDPTTKTRFRKNNRIMSWKSEIIGEGELEAVDSPESTQRVQLRFIKPFKSKASAALSWKVQDGATQVTWTMNGELPWFMALLIPMMKGWVRMDYRRGLNRLRELAEKGAIQARLHFDSNPGKKTGGTFIGITRRNVSIDSISEVMGKDAEKVLARLEPSSDHQCLCFYDKTSIVKGTFDYAFGILYTSDPPAVPQGAGWTTRTITEHTCVCAELQGSYDFLGDAWSMAMMSLKPNGLRRNKRIAPYESYIKGPHNSSKADNYQTRIEVPVR